MKLAFLLIALSVCGVVSAQENLFFSHINSNHGLSDNRVRALCQLPDGRMAVITEGLVNLYDGSDFRYMRFNHQTAYDIPEYTGWHRAYVAENLLWLKTQYKLMLFNIEDESYVANIDSIFKEHGAPGEAVNFFMDSDKNYWYLTERDELFYRDTRKNKTTLFLNSTSNLSGFRDLLYDIAVIKDQLFLFFRSGNMICYDISDKKELYRENPFNGRNEYQNTLMVVPHKQYLYQVRNGNNKGLLLRYNVLNKKWEKILKADYWLNTLTIDKNDQLWISSLAGLWLIDESLQNKRLISPLQLVDGRAFETEISTQYSDNKGGLWIGAVNRGLLYYHPDRFKFRNYGKDFFSGSQNLNVHCLAERHGTILAGTHNGLFQYNKDSQRFELFPGIPEDVQCNSLFNDSRGRIWLSTQNYGLFCIKSDRVVVFEQHTKCFDIFETFDGRFFIINNDGIGRFHTGTGQFEPVEFPAGHRTGNTVQLIELGKDKLLGANNGGLFIYDRKNKSVSFPQKNNVNLQHSNQQYHSLLLDSRGLIWFGTQNGLNVYDPETKANRCFFQEDGLINSSIRSIIEDNDGRIWVSTANGISRISIFSKDKSHEFSFVNFNRFDGVIENEFLPRSVLKTSDQRILWGGIDGFNEVEPNRINIPETSLDPPLFTRFLLSNEEIKPGISYDDQIILNKSVTSAREINLRHFQNFFSIEFSGLNYVNPTQTYYKYKLDGIDAEWREIKTADGVGRASYTNLSPGTYWFKVYAANNNRKWGNRYTGLAIIIHPPFWKTSWALFIYGILLSGFVYFLATYYVRLNRKKMLKRQKEAMNQFKFSFFTNVSHELRTPLSLIITPLASILKKTRDQELKHQLSGVYRNATELLDMVNQLLAFRKIEMKGETLQLTYCDVGEFVGSLMPSFNDLALEKGIDLSFESPGKNLLIYVDKVKLQKIVNNLLSNAFKFTPENGRISVRIADDKVNSKIILRVSDTGCGISANELPHLFERFYQAKNQNSSTGSGIGLYLIKEYVELHNGSVEVESGINEGATFTLSIPADLEPVDKRLTDSETPENKNALTILVVEDHAEFRKYLSRELSEKYNILMATNGREGLQKTREHQPDLVISDIMMPELSGTEFCKRLKNDLQISHIPFILLTAKSSDEARIEGLEAGADAYIAKPFNMDILLLRIHNLIEQREQRRDFFRKNIHFTAGALTSTRIDEELIKKALAHIEKNLSNASYSVEQLSKDMCMDRTGLYRKISAITGHPPTHFIRSVRLKKAAQLLENGLKVAEVADCVGFGTTSYFTKCFQEEFGIKPSDYRRQKSV